MAKVKADRIDSIKVVCSNCGKEREFETTGVPDEQGQQELTVAPRCSLCVQLLEADNKARTLGVCI